MTPLCYDSFPTRPFFLLAVLLLAGCGSESQTESATEQAQESATTPTAPALRVSDDENAMTVAELREQLGIGQAGQIRKVGGEVVGMDLRGTSVEDLAPVKGLPLRVVFLEDTKVTDLSPLAGMPLEQVYLSGTEVTDLSPLAGADLAELNLVGTPIEDLSALKEIEVGTLWIPETRVSDLTPLAGKSIVSLDLKDTPVSDLAPLAGNTALRRLHIGGTQVTDLTPLADLQLDRLIFSPEKITAGIDAIREMTSLQGLDVEFDGQSPVSTPEQFWQRYDAGEWSVATEGEQP